MLKNYETVFIMTPVLSDEQMKEAVGKFQKLLKDKEEGNVGQCFSGHTRSPEI